MARRLLLLWESCYLEKEEMLPRISNIRNLATLFVMAFSTAILSIAGCLYLEKIEPLNHPPEAELVLTSPGEQEIYLGTEVHLSAQTSHDPEGDDLRFEWSLEYDLTGPPPEDCGPFESSCDGGEGSTCCFVPVAMKTHTIYLRVYDTNGLRSPLQERILEVKNRLPEPYIVVETPPNDKGHYTVGQEVWLHAFTSYDPDQGDTSCSGCLYYWETTTRPAGSVTGVFQEHAADVDRKETSDESESLRYVVVPDYEGSYEVSLKVDDGVDPEMELDDLESRTAHIEVDPDGPPCIRFTDPDAFAEKHVFLLSEQRKLRVLRVEDDLDPFPPGSGLVFEWSIQAEQGQPFNVVSGSNEPYLILDPSDFYSGQAVRIRVTVQDRQYHDLSGCSPSESVCNLVSGCSQWVTWNIEFL